MFLKQRVGLQETRAKEEDRGRENSHTHKVEGPRVQHVVDLILVAQDGVPTEEECHAPSSEEDATTLQTIE